MNGGGVSHLPLSFFCVYIYISHWGCPFVKSLDLIGAIDDIRELETYRVISRSLWDGG